MKFGEYTVLEEIGHGASGFVYKVARDENEYAIKACIGFDHESRKRFDREIRLAQALQHPNIVKVYNFDMMASNPYFVMELCHSTLDKIAASLTFNEQVLKLCTMPLSYTEISSPQIYWWKKESAKLQTLALASF